MKVFSSNVRYYRYLMNYSQEKLAELCGLSTHYIRDIERSKYSPSIPTIETIAKALKIEANVLFIENLEARNLCTRIDIHRSKKNRK